jgi:hypothetical protein
MKRFNGKTARAWLIIFATGKMRLLKISAHIALEECYAEGMQAAAGSLYRFAAGAYENISQLQLQRLIAAVEKGGVAMGERYVVFTRYGSNVERVIGYKVSAETDLITSVTTAPYTGTQSVLSKPRCDEMVAWLKRQEVAPDEIIVEPY